MDAKGLNLQPTWSASLPRAASSLPPPASSIALIARGETFFSPYVLRRAGLQPRARAPLMELLLAEMIRYARFRAASPLPSIFDQIQRTRRAAKSRLKEAFDFANKSRGPLSCAREEIFLILILSSEDGTRERRGMVTLRLFFGVYFRPD